MEVITSETAIQSNTSNLQHLTGRQQQNYVPFNIKVNRFIPSSKKNQIPPIGTRFITKGSYNLPSCFDRKKQFLDERINKFLKKSEIKREQMGIFKSSINRFKMQLKEVPGPASYKQNNFDNSLFKNIDSSTANQKVPEKKAVSLDHTHTYPSIPFRENKFGYNLANGNLKIIDKTNQQIEKEKQSRKIYAESLAGENSTFREKPSDYEDNRKKLYMVSKKMFMNGNNQDKKNQSKYKLLRKKPKYDHIYNSKGGDVDKSYQQLGPGQYEVNQSSMTKAQKKQKFQFFGSTQVRFKQAEEKNAKEYSLLEMIKQKETQSKLQKVKRQKKETLSQSRLAKKLTDHIEIPGPGQYDPHINFIKKNRKAVAFGQEERFKDIVNRSQANLNNYQDINLQSDFQCSKSQKMKGNMKKSPKINYTPLKSQMIANILKENSDHESEKENKPLDKVRGHFKKPSNVFIQLSPWNKQYRTGVSSRGKNIRRLKQQLAIIEKTPSHNSVLSMSKNITKK